MRILVVEDDARLAAELVRHLGRAGFTPDSAGDAGSADFLAQTEAFDAIILDLSLPDGSGIDLLAAWRDQGVALPVLVLTARERWADKLAAFRAGADDYVTKPFLPDEVILRLHALIRRAHGQAAAILRAGPVALDTATGLASLDGAALDLTGFETRILVYLMHNPGRIVSRAELADHLYGAGNDRDYGSLEVVLGRLRRKLDPGRIVTHRGLGYRLCVE
jgi:two-component system OmpR family response regulator